MRRKRKRSLLRPCVILLTILTVSFVMLFSVFAEAPISYEWGSAPGVTGTLIDAEVKMGAQYERAVAVIPEDHATEYLTLRFDARTLKNNSSGNMLVSYMELIDLYDKRHNDHLRASSYGGGNGYIYIDNQSDKVYDIVAVQFDPTAKNLNFADAVWTPSMTQTLQNSTTFETFYQKYKDKVDGAKYSPTYEELEELENDYADNATGVDGYQRLVGETYYSDSFDIKTATDNLLAPNSNNAYYLGHSITDGFYKDLARYRAESFTYMMLGKQSVGYSDAYKPEYNVGFYTGEPEAGSSSLLTQLDTLTLVESEADLSIPLSIVTYAPPSSNAYTNVNIRMDVAFQLVLKMRDFVPLEEPLDPDDEFIDEPVEPGEDDDPIVEPDPPVIRDTNLVTEDDKSTAIVTTGSVNTGNPSHSSEILFGIAVSGISAFIFKGRKKRKKEIKC